MAPIALLFVTLASAALLTLLTTSSVGSVTWPRLLRVFAGAPGAPEEAPRFASASLPLTSFRASSASSSPAPQKAPSDVDDRGEAVHTSASSAAEDTAIARGQRLAEIPSKAGALVPLDLDEDRRSFEPSEPGACLQFVHIPKTAGTTMEGLYETSLRSKKSVDSRVPGWGRNNKPAACSAGRKDRRCPMQHSTTCNFFHTPPLWDEMLWSTAYAMCDTFCIVRHPVDRFVSEWQYRNNRPCTDTEHFFKWARGKLDSLKKGSLYMDDCHLLPQHFFVVNISKAHTPRTTCQHILRFNRLEEDFSALMRTYRYPMTLANKKRGNARAKCDIAIPEDILDGIRLVYAVDFGLFGFD